MEIIEILWTRPKILERTKNENNEQRPTQFFYHLFDGLTFACSSDRNPLKKEEICKSLNFTGFFQYNRFSLIFASTKIE